MARLHKRDIGKFPHEHAPNICWFCGDNLWKDNQFVVMWAAAGSGYEEIDNTGITYMHPDCAEHLGTRIIHDVVRGKMEIKGIWDQGKPSN